MAGRGESRAQANKRIREEALREQLQAKGLVQHVLEISDKLADLDIDLDSVKVQRLKAAADIKKGLIAKYLPDLKQVENDHTSSDGSMTPPQVIEIVAKDQSQD